MATASVACILSFWFCAFLAGAVAADYSIRGDYISSLAGRGSSVALLGIVGLVLLGTAHLAAAAAVWEPVAREKGPGTAHDRQAATPHPGRPAVVAVPLVVAGLAGLTVAAFRTNCPAGAAGCGWAGNDPPADLAGMTHGYAVVVYELAIVTTMLIAAGESRRARPVFATLTVIAAVASVLLALQIGGPDTGWWQRGWLLINTGWLAWFVQTAVRPSGPGTWLRAMRQGSRGRGTRE